MNKNQEKPLATKVGETEFESEVLMSREPVLATLGASWSRPRHALDAVLGQVGRNYRQGGDSSRDAAGPFGQQFRSSGSKRRTKLINTETCEPRPPVPPRRYSAKRTRHRVNFFCDAPKAKRVRLVGDFNGWDLAATPMRRMRDGCWTASLELHHGHHRYRFVIDGKPVLDPNASGITHNDDNEEVSLIAVS